MKLSLTQQSNICQAVGYYRIVDITPMQSLWAGHGGLARLSLSSLKESGSENTNKAQTLSLVAKQVVMNSGSAHPRGWSGERAQARKLRSYQVELHWYREFAKAALEAVPVAPLYYAEPHYAMGIQNQVLTDQNMLMVLADLATDYPVRFTSGKDDRPSHTQIKSSIRWLANFHARFLNHTADGLWESGGYWHLDTRPDEFETMANGELKAAAHELDHKLKSCRYQTIIHGDAKLANFCFDETGEQAAAVDFQYVGAGVGVKDLMLLLSSVMPDERLLIEAEDLVEYYFEQLAAGLSKWQKDVISEDVTNAWRPLYAVAWADFHRFLAGWSPNHWKIGDYCHQQTTLALAHDHCIGSS